MNYLLSNYFLIFLVFGVPGLPPCIVNKYPMKYKKRKKKSGSKYLKNYSRLVYSLLIGWNIF